jgi:hypothetical protein
VVALGARPARHGAWGEARITLTDPYALARAPGLNRLATNVEIVATAPPR